MTQQSALDTIVKYVRETHSFSSPAVNAILGRQGLIDSYVAWFSMEYPELNGEILQDPRMNFYDVVRDAHWHNGTWLPHGMDGVLVPDELTEERSKILGAALCKEQDRIEDPDTIVVQDGALYLFGPSSIEFMT